MRKKRNFFVPVRKVTNFNLEIHTLIYLSSTALGLSQLDTLQTKNSNSTFSYPGQSRPWFLSKWTLGASHVVFKPLFSPLHSSFEIWEKSTAFGVTVSLGKVGFPSAGPESCACGAIFEQLFSFVSMVQCLNCQKGARFHQKVPEVAKIYEESSLILLKVTPRLVFEEN